MLAQNDTNSKQVFNFKVRGKFAIKLHLACQPHQVASKQTWYNLTFADSLRVAEKTCINNNKAYTLTCFAMLSHKTGRTIASVRIDPILARGSVLALTTEAVIDICLQIKTHCT